MTSETKAGLLDRRMS